MKHCLVFGYGQEADGRIDEQTEDRCRKALGLYRNRKIEKIYLTVSASKNGVSMALAMREFLVEQGVNENDIVVEPRGGNTAGEIDVFLSIVPDGAKVVFVSTWYHLSRIAWLALWRIRLTHFALGVTWRHAHFKADVLVEFLKLANAILRPRRSSKVVNLGEYGNGIYDRELFTEMMIDGLISAEMFNELDRRGQLRVSGYRALQR